MLIHSRYLLVPLLICILSPPAYSLWKSLRISAPKLIQTNEETVDLGPGGKEDALRDILFITREELMEEAPIDSVNADILMKLAVVIWKPNNPKWVPGDDNSVNDVEYWITPEDHHHYLPITYSIQAPHYPVDVGWHNLASSQVAKYRIEAVVGLDQGQKGPASTSDYRVKIFITTEDQIAIPIRRRRKVKDRL